MIMLVGKVVLYSTPQIILPELAMIKLLAKFYNCLTWSLSSKSNLQCAQYPGDSIQFALIDSHTWSKPVANICLLNVASIWSNLIAFQLRNKIMSAEILYLNCCLIVLRDFSAIVACMIRSIDRFFVTADCCTWIGLKVQTKHLGLFENFGYSYHSYHSNFDILYQIWTLWLILTPISPMPI